MTSDQLYSLALFLRGAGENLIGAANVVVEMAQAEPPPVIPPVIPPPPIDTIKTPAELDAALATAKPGDVLVLDYGLRYLTPLTIGVSVRLMGSLISNTRAVPGTPMPIFKDGITVNAVDVVLECLEIQKIDPLTDIVVINGAGCEMDGCRVLGDPTHGAKRGIAGNAPDVTIRRCYVADCFGTYPGNDTQAFAAWNSPGPFLLEDNYFSGGSETILFGGADPVDPAHVPSNIVIRGNTITKNPAWQAQNIGVKNTIELKNARHVLIEDNDIEYSWGGHGQDGYLVMLTPRNQDGTAPESEVFDVTIQQNRFRHASAAVAMLGRDDLHPSGTLHRLLIQDNEFVDLDPQLYTGSNKMVFVGNGPIMTTIQDNKFVGKNIGSVLYLDGAPKCSALGFVGNTVPHSEYGVMGSGCAPGGINDPHGSAWTTFVESGQLEGNIEA